MFNNIDENNFRLGLWFILMCVLLFLLCISLNIETANRELKLIENIVFSKNETGNKIENKNALIPGNYDNIVKLNNNIITTMYTLKQYKLIKNTYKDNHEKYNYEINSDCDDNMIFNSNESRNCKVFFRDKK